MARSTIVHHETAVGAFAILAGALLAGFFVVKGARAGIGSREVVFTADSGHNLKRGAPVKMRGIEVGEVSDVQLTDDNRVRVQLSVFSDYRDNVRSGAKAQIVEPPILGSTSIELLPGSGDPVKQGSAIDGEVQEGILHQVQASTTDAKKILDRVTAMADKADQTLAAVAAVTSRINQGQGLAGRLVTDEKLADDFTNGVRELSGLVADIRAGRGAFALLRDGALVADVRSAVADVRSVTSAVARGDGALGRLATNDTLIREGELVLKDARGALARLDEIARTTQETSQKIIPMLESARGALDRLDGTIKNAEKITAELAQVSEKINRGEGTLAKLVNDDALFREAKALLKELRESVEDLREQAPINSFIGVVFAAF